MSGRLGVASVKSILSLGKIGVINVLQAAAKDGFQASDLLAPMLSPTFQNSLVHSLDDFAMALPELADLDLWDGIEIGRHLHSCWLDIKTELNLAINKSKALRVVAL